LVSAHQNVRFVASGGHKSRRSLAGAVLKRVPGSCNVAFVEFGLGQSELEKQVKKHEAKLRKDCVWKRKRAISAPTLHEASSD
jgi:hypothetical protein